MKRALWLLALAAGCAPLAHGGRARVLPVGRNEVTFAPEVTLLSTKITPEGVTLPSLQLGLGYHRGVTQRLELGGRVWGFGVERADLRTWGAALDAKIQLQWQDPLTGGADIAVAPSGGYHQMKLGGTPEHFAFASVPLLVGLPVGRRHQLVFGPRVAWHAWWGESQRAQRHVFYGGSVAFALALGERFVFIPELVLLWSPIQFGGEAPQAEQKGATYMSLGLGVGLGF